MVVALLSIMLGYAFLHGSLQNPRPHALETAMRVPDPEDTHKVLSRLWQDPFETFEAATNASPAAGAAARAQTNDDRLLWNEIAKRSTNSDCPVIILGVMLEGGGYAEDKEVRLRTRYAVEMALLTWEWGPEDRTHILTNSVCLTLDEKSKYGRSSRYAYEWFGIRYTNISTSDDCQICVLWLNENDFADNPALRLGSLLGKIPAVTNPNGNTSFYLIGPRSSDTLRALDKTDMNGGTANLANFVNAVQSENFHILSPEATASVRGPLFVDPTNQDLRDDFNKQFGADFFHPWIATDQQIAGQLARELHRRVTRLTQDTNNVVVLLSEQDTYYGSMLADEWIYALMTNGVCTDINHVWQFGYLRGLDGSKPQTQVSEPVVALASAPEAALETAMKQQRAGQRADGDAQMDYVLRLTEFLKGKDREMKKQGRGRIIAIGFTGSDPYDKMILGQELRRHFPEAVFFTTDLDASYWTGEGLKYDVNLLVGSAYPLDPQLEGKPMDYPSTQDQFAPFRDVYQMAVFRACSGVIMSHVQNDYNYLDAPLPYLQGDVYKIGRHGPVKLSDPNTANALNTPPQPRYFSKRHQLWLIPLVAGLVMMVLYFFAIFKGGIQGFAGNWDYSGSKNMQDVVEKERSRQISRRWLVRGLWLLLALIILAWLFVYLSWKCAGHPGEEPWDFTDGVSIWFSEYLRFGVCVGVAIFGFIAFWRQRHHRRKLWELYFCEGDASQKAWDKFLLPCRKRWRDEKKAGWRFWRNSVRPSKKACASLTQAEAEMDHERTVSLIGAWTPPFVEVPVPGGVKARPEVCINAAVLFKCYLRLGRMRHRIRRSLVSVVLYAMAAFSMVMFLRDFPTLLLIRGHWSHVFDITTLVLSVSLTLLGLFYVFDAAVLTKRVLDYVSRHGTRWPDTPLRKQAGRYGVSPQHLDGLLDMDFTAVQTGEIGPLMFGPIILLLVLLFSRIPYFDCWTWPTGLIVIFVTNFLTAAICWWLVRRAAENVRKDALERMDAAILAVTTTGAVCHDLPSFGTLPVLTKLAPEEQKVYVGNLATIRKKIEDERRGAFANWFQDPTYLAVFVPSSISGIISLICSFWLSK